jgi:hypothetical protein
VIVLRALQITQENLSSVGSIIQSYPQRPFFYIRFQRLGTDVSGAIQSTLSSSIY